MMKHEWSYQEGPTPRQCMNCGGTDEKQRCVPRPKGKKADDGRRCIGCPATSPDFVVQPNGQLTSVCVACAQAKSYWVCRGVLEDGTLDPIELHATLELAVAGADAILRRGHLKPVFVWDASGASDAMVVARSLRPKEVELCRRLGIELGFDDDDPDQHQYRHLVWRGMRTRALCKGSRLWFHGAIGETEAPLIDCDECLGQWQVLAASHEDAKPAWTQVELFDVVERLAAQHLQLFTVFCAASDLLWAIENPDDAQELAQGAANYDQVALRNRLMAALNGVHATPESPLRQRQLERTLAGALKALPTCWRCKKEKNDPIAMATHQSLDAAGDPMFTCDAHSRPGGFDDSGPFPLSWAKWVKQANALLSP